MQAGPKAQVAAPRATPQPSARHHKGSPPAAVTRQAPPAPKTLAAPQEGPRHPGRVGDKNAGDNNAGDKGAATGREAARPISPGNAARQGGPQERQLAQPPGRDNAGRDINAETRGPGGREALRQNQQPQLAGANRGPSPRVLRNQAVVQGSTRNAAGRAFAQSTFQGRFADHSRQWRRHNSSFVIGWAGPLFWPYAYSDFVDYTFYSYGSDTFWPYAYDDLYESVFGRYAYGSAYAAVPPEANRRGGRRAGAAAERRAVAATDVCSAQAAGLTDWPVEQIAQAVQVNDSQRAALDGLKGATAKAVDILQSACPSELPSTPTGRLAAMGQRLDAMLQAVQIIRPALDAFYQSLDDEQRARFNALGPEDDPDQQQSRRNLAQVCGERASGIASLPLERIERAVRPDEAQRSALRQLQDATSVAVNRLKTECPDYQALTPTGRLDAMQQRLDAMLRAVRTVQPALENFYGSLGDEQKERFNRLGPAQG
jgi:LTXXQ motif family protein